MEMFETKEKEQLLEALEALGEGIPLMGRADRDFTASLLYRMSKIVREHGRNYGVSLNSPVIDEVAKFEGIRIGDFHFKPTRDGFSLSKGRTPKIEYNLEDTVKKVIYAPPATVIYWKDGTKTVVKCSDQDIAEGRLSPETGIAYAIAKKVLGNKGNYNNVLRRLVKRAKKS